MSAGEALAVVGGSRVVAFWQSTIGKKVVMAATGLVMLAFIISHVLANLLVFRGTDEINRYSAFLKSTGSLLWLARGGLLVSLVLHVIAAWQLTRREQLARPVGYAKHEPQVSTTAARTIRWGGVALLLFIIYHLLHLTFGTLHPAFDRKDIYGNVIVAFQIWWVTAIYLVAMVALGLHLYHGAWSSFRTLGLARPTTDPLRRRVVTILSIAIYAGFSIIPLAVLLGLIR